MAIVSIERAQPADHAATRTLLAAHGLPDAGPALRPIMRADVHPAVHRSLEWTAACPASAQAMLRDLIPTGEH